MNQWVQFGRSRLRINRRRQVGEGESPTCFESGRRILRPVFGQIGDKLVVSDCFVLFCFVWLATLGVPVVAPGTAAGTFRRVVEAPFSRPSSPVVERGALSTEVPPHLKTR